MKGRRSQADKVQEMPERVLILNLYVTQLILAFSALVSGWFLGVHWLSFLQLFRWQPIQIGLYGGSLAAFTLGLDWLLTQVLPEGLYDDGGINERMFSSLSIPHIFLVTVIVAFVEEILFRGILQEQFGLIAASLIFAGLHLRYLRKFVLFAVTVGLSFLLGLFFLVTHNLFVTIFAHFCIDFVLGVSIRVNNRSLQKIKEGEAEMMEQAYENENFQLKNEELEILPPRSEFHNRSKKSEGEQKGKKKHKNPFLLVRLLLAAFIILVVGTLVFSISNQYFSL
ncbi:MAG TPA: CPBP family intramembrane glutamic endopeptidase [Bacillales bacterium]|nr:CPBP family intramembrane glutamic endopeptidase [Bacillales bacterium]